MFDWKEKRFEDGADDVSSATGTNTADMLSHFETSAPAVKDRRLPKLDTDPSSSSSPCVLSAGGNSRLDPRSSAIQQQNLCFVSLSRRWDRRVFHGQLEFFWLLLVSSRSAAPAKTRRPTFLFPIRRFPFLNKCRLARADLWAPCRMSCDQRSCFTLRFFISKITQTFFRAGGARSKEEVTRYWWWSGSAFFFFLKDSLSSWRRAVSDDACAFWTPF